MKTLCLGGSFNPIHHGHLICAREVAESCGFERVMLIPTGQPPHKADSALASGPDRLEMCRLAIKNEETGPSTKHVRFEVSDLEIRRPGASYTIDTVRELKNSGWPEVHWLIGADMLNYLPNWHESAALLNEAKFLVIARPGVKIEWSKLPAEYASLKGRVVEAPLIDISGSDIRRRVHEGKAIQFLTPSAVVEYITKRGLYRG